MRSEISKWNESNFTESLMSLSKSLGRTPVKRDSGALYGASRKLFGSWNKALKSVVFSTKEIQARPIIPKELDERLSYFLGLLITDGHIVFKPRYKVMLFTSYIEEREVIIELIGNLFKYRPSVRSKNYGFNKKRTNYEIYISSRDLASFIIKNFEIPSGAKSSIVRLPLAIKNGALQNKMAFIRGVIDGDGYVAEKFVRFSSGSRLFLEDIKLLLKGFGLNPGKIQSDKRNSTFTLNLYRKNELNWLALNIYRDAEFFYPRKKLSWERYLNQF